MVICIYLIITLSKPVEASKNTIKIIASPIFNDILDQFKSKGKDFTNIFKLKL